MASRLAPTTDKRLSEAGASVEGSVRVRALQALERLCAGIPIGPEPSFFSVPAEGASAGDRGRRSGAHCRPTRGQEPAEGCRVPGRADARHKLSINALGGIGDPLFAASGIEGRRLRRARVASLRNGRPSCLRLSGCSNAISARTVGPTVRRSRTFVPFPALAKRRRSLKSSSGSFCRGRKCGTTGCWWSRIASASSQRSGVARLGWRIRADLSAIRGEPVRAKPPGARARSCAYGARRTRTYARRRLAQARAAGDPLQKLPIGGWPELRPDASCSARDNGFARVRCAAPA